jgi:hypothetical protein
VLQNNTSMKIVNSSPITPFGGINFVIKEAIDLNINNLINSNMVDLAKQSQYTWFDIIMSYWSGNDWETHCLCGKPQWKQYGTFITA